MFINTYRHDEPQCKAIYIIFENIYKKMLIDLEEDYIDIMIINIFKWHQINYNVNDLKVKY